MTSQNKFIEKCIKSIFHWIPSGIFRRSIKLSLLFLLGWLLTTPHRTYFSSFIRHFRFFHTYRKNTTILSNRSKILQKRNKHSDYHIMIKYLSHYNNFIVNGPCNEKNIFKKMIFFYPCGHYFIFIIILFNFLIKNISKLTFSPLSQGFDLTFSRLL